ncbi:MAG TPA: response regulator [Solirubrobacterales bacterium]|jgi:CheY-like chemotaxis protein
MAQRVLVGDDNEQMRRLIVELLLAEGHEVREARDAGGVLEHVSRSRPDLVILDVHMPGGGGLEALREIRSDPANAELPILLLSGSVDLNVDLATGVGANAQLPKPFRIDEFRETVAGLLSR